MARNGRPARLTKSASMPVWLPTQSNWSLVIGNLGSLPITNCQLLMTVFVTDRAGYTPPPVPPAEIRSRIRFYGVAQALGPAPGWTVGARAARNVFVALVAARHAEQHPHGCQGHHQVRAAITDERQG